MSHDDDLRRRLDVLLRDITSREPLCQAVMAVETGDRSFRWVGGAGAPDLGGETVTAESPFFLASIDKLPNATIVLKLSDSGEVDLDATLATYLPAGLVKGIRRADGVDRSGEIILRHLLSHTSGLADRLEDRPIGGRSLKERVCRRRGHGD